MRDLQTEATEALDERDLEALAGHTQGWQKAAKTYWRQMGGETGEEALAARPASQRSTSKRGGTHATQRIV